MCQSQSVEAPGKKRESKEQEIRMSSTTGGVRKVKKVTKTVTKSSKGDGETTVETVTKMTSSSEASGRDGDMTNNVSNGEVSGDNMVNGR